MTMNLAFSKRLVNIGCLIVQNHISVLFYVSTTIWYSKFSLDIKFLEQYFLYWILTEALNGTAICDCKVNQTILTNLWLKDQLIKYVLFVWIVIFICQGPLELRKSLILKITKIDWIIWKHNSILWELNRTRVKTQNVRDSLTPLFF
jgi:hypothetical protein